MSGPDPRVDELVRPWFDAAVAAAGTPLDLFDVHTHIGQNDPDGFSCSREELLAALDVVGARAAVFPMHEPEGYPPANDAVLADAEASGGRLAMFCRVDPHAGAPAEARRCLDAGAAGVKLHPRAERFTLDHPEVLAVARLCAEREVPMLVHAGRGIPALGRHAVELATALPALRLILAHAGISDLAWIHREAAARPNLFFDTSWWSPADLLFLACRVPPGQVLWATDLPYGLAAQSAAVFLRCALQAGHGAAALRAMMGEQAARLVAGEAPLDLGPAIGEDAVRSSLGLERVATFLLTALGRMTSGSPEFEESLALARLACAVPDDDPDAAACASIVELLDRRDAYAATAAPSATRFAPGIHLVATACAIAQTPDVPVPDP